MADYELKSLDLPRLTGAALKVFTAAVEASLTRSLLLPGLLENGGIPKLRRITLDEPPTFIPLVKAETPTDQPAGFVPGAAPAGFPYRTARDYTAAYLDGTLTPVEAAEAVLAAISASEQGDAPLHAFIAVYREDVMAQARSATLRRKSGLSLSPLDGVPVAVKDEIDMKPYPTTVGTRFLGKTAVTEDSTVAARLRAAGAILVGKTNMHEIGINPNGANANHGTMRNPFNPACDAGGSSTGSAVAVAAGLVPLAIGADGGGSIRIPSGLCGLVGLKPTFARVSGAGGFPLCWSVDHFGPMAACVEDTALGYSLIAGPDPRMPESLAQPPVTLAGWNNTDLYGVRLGVYRQWFEHANPEVVQVCQAMLEQLKRAGAEICPVTIPGLDEIRIAHAITILSEMAAAMHAYRSQRSLQGAAVRLSLVLGEATTAIDYIQAQRVRTRALATFHKVFQQVDAILTPATALAAQPIMAAGLKDGWSDLGTDTEMMRFVFPANFTGNPAISFPAGYDGRGLPIGMQAIGRHWGEALLLRIAYTAEQSMTRRKPERFYKVF